MEAQRFISCAMHFIIYSFKIQNIFAALRGDLLLALHSFQGFCVPRQESFS